MFIKLLFLLSPWGMIIIIASYRTHSISNTGLSDLWRWRSLIFIAILGDSYFYNLHFVGEEDKTQRSKVAALISELGRARVALHQFQWLTVTVQPHWWAHQGEQQDRVRAHGLVLSNSLRLQGNFARSYWDRICHARISCLFYVVIKLLQAINSYALMLQREFERGYSSSSRKQHD